MLIQVEDRVRLLAFGKEAQAACHFLISLSLAAEALAGIDPVALQACRHRDPVRGAGQPTALG